MAIGTSTAEYGRGTGVPHPADVLAGMRVRTRRLLAGMSQETLAQILGVVFQQMQKNEAGDNRIGASRIQSIAEILQAPAVHFFPPLSATIEDIKAQIEKERIFESEGCAVLVARYLKMSPLASHRLLALLLTISKTEEEPLLRDVSKQIVIPASQVRPARSRRRASSRKGPEPVDVFVGGQVKKWRNDKDMSQQKLAEAVEVAFQQVQKYERGSNRISVSKLWEIGRALDQPITRFFSDDAEAWEYELSWNDPFQEPDIQQLGRAFAAVDVQTRRHILVIAADIPA